MPTVMFSDKRSGPGAPLVPGRDPAEFSRGTVDGGNVGQILVVGDQDDLSTLHHR